MDETEIELKSSSTTKKEKALQKKSDDFLDKCKNFFINDQEDYITAGIARNNGKEHIKSIEEFLDPHIARAFVAHRGLTSDKTRLIAPVKEGRVLLGQTMEEWDAHIREKAKKEEDRLRKEAEEKAKKEEAQRLREQAKELKKEGDSEGADALREEAKNPVVESPLVNIDVVPATPKVKGTHYRDHWDVKLVSKKDVPLEYMTVDMAMVKAVVTKTKGAVVPKGIRATKSRRAI